MWSMTRSLALRCFTGTKSAKSFRPCCRDHGPCCWSLLKRVINGTYVPVKPFHLFRPLDAHAYHYNTANSMTPNGFASRFQARQESRHIRRSDGQEAAQEAQGVIIGSLGVRASASTALDVGSGSIMAQLTIPAE